MIINNEHLFSRALFKIAENPDLLENIFEFSENNNKKMSNIPRSKIFWEEMANANGWRIQKCTVFKYIRILDPSDNLIDVGAEEIMIGLLKDLVQ